MPLSPETLQELKTKLLTEKSRLEEDLGRFAKPVGKNEFETVYEDLGENYEENATEVGMYADNKALEATLENELREVEAALGRMNAGTYGICENSGKEIPLERLRAYPAARTRAEHVA